MANSAHKYSFDMQKRLLAEKEARLAANLSAQSHLAASSAELASSRKAASSAEAERDQVVAAYYNTSEELIEVF